MGNRASQPYLDHAHLIVSLTAATAVVASIGAREVLASLDNLVSKLLRRVLQIRKPLFNLLLAALAQFSKALVRGCAQILCVVHGIRGLLMRLPEQLAHSLLQEAKASWWRRHIGRVGRKDSYTWN